MATQQQTNLPVITRRSSSPNRVNITTTATTSTTTANQNNNNQGGGSILSSRSPSPSSSSLSSGPSKASSPSIRLIALLPPGPNTSLSDYKPVIQAGIDARYYRDQDPVSGTHKHNPVKTLNDVIIGIDEEIHAETVELIGSKLYIDIPCRVRLPYLVLQIKDTGRFFGIELGIVAVNGKQYSLLVTNKSSNARITTETCSIPLDIISKQWNLLRLNLADLTERAWGTEYSLCTGVILHSSVAIARVYFESVPMEDYELPLFLRTIKKRK